MTAGRAGFYTKWRFISFFRPTVIRLHYRFIFDFILERVVYILFVAPQCVLNEAELNPVSCFAAEIAACLAC